MSEDTTSSETRTQTSKSASKIMIAIMGSRILGLVREVILNAIFGAGRELDAFITAFRIPNMLRDLFAEGALSVAFVTTFSKILEKDGKAAAFRLANLVATTLLLLMLVITLLGIIFADVLVNSFLGVGFSADKQELTILLTRILFPFILFVSFAALTMGLLNSLGSFGLPASASIAFNATSIVLGVTFAWIIDPTFGPASIFGFAIGTLIGGLAQLGIQIPRTLQYGYQPQWLIDFSDPGLRKVGELMLPALIGGAGIQINVLVNQYFASCMAEGSVTCHYNAFRLMLLPLGMFGVAVSMVTLPAASRSVASENMDKFRSHIREALSLTFLLSLPSAIGLAILAEPIVSVIYERGRFTAEDRELTAAILQFFCIALVTYSGMKVLSPVFYALNLTQWPYRITMGGVLLNLALLMVFILGFGLGIRSLPLSTSIVTLLNFSLLLLMMSRHTEGILDHHFLKRSGKILVASISMGAVILLADLFLPTLGFESWFMKATTLGVTILLGGATYAAVCLILKIEQFTDITRAIRRRLS